MTVRPGVMPGYEALVWLGFMAVLVIGVILITSAHPAH